MRESTPRWMDAHGPELERHLLRMVGDPDDVSDLLQHVWMRAWSKLPVEDTGLNVRAWLFRVATNAALDRLAHKKRWRTRLAALAADPLAAALDPPRAPLSRRTQGQVREALRRLPRKQREAVWFRWVEGLEYTQVAHKLECSPESARANVHHGLKRLRRTLADLAEEE